MHAECYFGGGELLFSSLVCSPPFPCVSFSTHTTVVVRKPSFAINVNTHAHKSCKTIYGHWCLCLLHFEGTKNEFAGCGSHQPSPALIFVALKRIAFARVATFWKNPVKSGNSKTKLSRKQTLRKKSWCISCRGKFVLSQQSVNAIIFHTAWGELQFTGIVRWKKSRLISYISRRKMPGQISEFVPSGKWQSAALLMDSLTFGETLLNIIGGDTNCCPLSNVGVTPYVKCCPRYRPQNRVVKQQVKSNLLLNITKWRTEHIMQNILIKQWCCKII